MRQKPLDSIAIFIELWDSDIQNINRSVSVAIRKQFLSSKKPDSELMDLIAKSRAIEVTEEMLREQRISFAFGNALHSDSVTKDSVRTTSQHIRLKTA